METRLIMLPNPILCSDENIVAGDKVFMITNNLLGKYGDIITIISTRESRTEITKANGKWHWFACDANYQREKTYKKIVAGIEGKPTLDLSDIAERFGLIDIENIIKEEMGLPNYLPVESMSPTTAGSFDFGVECFKRGLELNNKKFSIEEILCCVKASYGIKYFSEQKFIENLEKVSRPDEFIVETKKEGNKIKVIEIVKECN